MENMKTLLENLSDKARILISQARLNTLLEIETNNKTAEVKSEAVEN